ncbi:MAG: FG-GAP-like repeat-containing protein, partial [Bacteroidota bacterium]|nr:FG-GAP-like repeat-containing protein [Bacteroidota bacterium]
WIVNGLSVISRTKTTLYHDGYIDGVDFDGNDKYLLDGQRLIAINDGGYGNDNTEYHTENEIFAKVLSFNSDNLTDPDYFKVFSKNGLVYEYGKTASTRVEGSDCAPNFMFCYNNKISDRNGNSIEYIYYNENGLGLIKEINYSNIKVVFNYIERNDINTYYLYGNAITQNKKLESIEIKVGGDLFNRYEFKYDPNSYTTHLTSIDYFGNDGVKHFNPTTFEWGSEQSNFNLQTTSIVNEENPSELTFGDFNGDGKTDVLHAYYTYTKENLVDKKYLYWTIDYSQSNGTLFQEVEMGSLETGEYDPSFLFFLSGGDLNGDGKDDLIKVLSLGSDVVYYQFMFSDGSGFVDGPSFSDGSYNDYFRFGDLNGNGINEFLIIRKLSIGTHIRAFEYDPTSNTNYTQLFLFVYEHNDETLNEINTGDFNGDGKTDLLINTEANITGIYEYDGDGLSKLYETGYPTKWHRVRTGDFNGDGITDILTFAYTDSNPHWSMKYFNGKDSWKRGDSPLLRNIDPDESNCDNLCMIADYNGDGKDDILEIYNKISGYIVEGSYYNVFYSTGQEFYKESELFAHAIPFYDNIYSGFDFNGDSKSDCFIKFPPTPEDPRKILFLHKNGQGNLIQKIHNSFGSETRFAYETLSKGSFYTPQGNASNHVIDFQPSWYVCHHMSQSNGVGRLKTIAYNYEGAKLHVRGKGFLGFAKVTHQNIITGYKEEMLYGYNETFFNTYLAESNTYANDQLLVNRTYLNSVKHFGMKRIFSYTNASFTKEYDLNGSFVRTIKSKSFFSDNDIQYGNLTSSKVLIDENDLNIDSPESEFNYKILTDFKYVKPDIVNWNIGLVERQSVTKSSPENPDDIKIVFYEHDKGYNPLLRMVLNETPSGYEMFRVNTTCEYDSFGNVIKETIDTPEDQTVDPIVTEYEYSSDYNSRFLTKKWKRGESNVFTEEYTYDPVMGNSLSYKDINGLVTEYSYDEFGRLKKTITPNNVVTLSVLKWSTDTNTDAPLHSMYYTWTRQSGMEEKLIYFDELNRKLRGVDYMYDGTKRYSDIEYDNLMNIYRTSMPYAKNGNPIWTTFAYDKIQRRSCIYKPKFTMEYAYNGRTITEKNTTTNQFSIKQADALGQLRMITDNGGSVKYSYYSSGLPKDIVSFGDTIHMEYDPLGNKLVMDDPDAGKYEYVYNAIGSVIEQIDPKLRHEKYTYDNMGRLVIHECHEGIIDYTYDVADHGLGKLSNVRNYNGISKTYTYDELGRLNSETEDILGEKFISTFGYDGIGRPNQKTYPSGVKVTQKYNSNGFLQNVSTSADNGYLMEAVSYNELGQLEEYRMGNGKITKNMYDQYGFPERFTTPEIMDQEYVFDYAWGNLTSRTDKLSATTLHESFLFDQNDRLINCNVLNMESLTLSYKANGNIDTKSNIGTFVYGENNAGSHAVTSIKSISGARPIHDQIIEYTSFNKINKIEEQEYSYDVIYDSERKRKKTIMRKNSKVQRTKFYSDMGYEKEIYPDGLVRELHFLPGAVYVKRSDDKDSLYYVYSDYLGSPNAITDEVGNVVERLSFDAWGKRRNPDDWSYNNVPTSSIFDRGFTGHEHLDAFGLINMNGRVYDPALARFLSPDPFIQAPEISQNYNRYSYALNNPLKYTDPTGYSYIDNRKSDNRYEGGGFWYRGSYFSYDSDSKTFSDGKTVMSGGSISYDFTDGTYKNACGKRVSWRNVNRNIVSPNATALPLDANVTVEFGTSDGVDGVWFISSEWSPIKRKDTQYIMAGEVTATFVADGSAGGGKSNAFNIVGGATGIMTKIIQGGFDAARKTQPTVSTWSKGGRFFGRGTNILSGISVGYDFVTGTANTSTIVNICVSVVGYGAIAIVGAAATPYVIGVGIVYGVVSIAGGDEWLNNTWDNSHINFIKP